MREPARVAAIVLHWRSLPDTLACLASLEVQTRPADSVLVVLNDARADDEHALREAHPNVRLLPLAENRGFTGGNNAGMQLALEHGADWLWLLNDDVVLAPDALAALLAAADEDEAVGFAGPLVCLAEQPEHVLTAGGELVAPGVGRLRAIGRPVAEVPPEPRDVDFLSGCALLVRRAVVEEVGPLDEAYFAYLEDLEWCQRGARAGWRVRFVPEARAWHPDPRPRDADSANVLYYMNRNRLMLLARHGHGPLAVAGALWTIARTWASWSLRPRWRERRVLRPALLRAVLDFARGYHGPAPEWRARA